MVALHLNYEEGQWRSTCSCFVGTSIIRQSEVIASILKLEHFFLKNTNFELGMRSKYVKRIFHLMLE
jgi:hypothetical protein